MIENASAEAIQFTGLSHKIHRAASASAPCIFLIHGRAGNQEVMWTFKRVVPENWTIIAPQAPLSDPLGGYSWWLVKEHWSKDEAIAASSLLLDFISKALSFYSLSPNKIYASGFSQGGAVLSLCLQAQPQLFSRVALLASFIIEHEFNSSSKQLP